MTLVTKRMKFKDSGTMNRFLLLYMDVFQPWSEDTIRCDAYVKDRICYDKNGKWTGTSRGHQDPNVVNMMKKGYRIFDDNRVNIHLEPAEFKKIEKLFKKEKIRVNQYMYVFES